MKHWVPLWVLPTIVVFAIGTVWVRLAIVDTTYAIGEVGRQIATIRQDNERLQVRLAALRSPRRLQRLAGRRHHLSAAQANQVVHVAQLRSHPEMGRVQHTAGASKESVPRQSPAPPTVRSQSHAPARPLSHLASHSLGQSNGHSIRKVPATSLSSRSGSSVSSDLPLSHSSAPSPSVSPAPLTPASPPTLESVLLSGPIEGAGLSAPIHSEIGRP